MLFSRPVNVMAMALSLSALELFMENHFYPLMKLVSSVLRTASIFERRLQKHLAAVKRSPWLRLSTSDYPAVATSRFWKEHPHSIPWATFGSVSRRCQEICRARLQILDMPRVPALPSRADLAYFAIRVTGGYISHIQPLALPPDHPVAVEAVPVLEEVQQLNQEFETIMTRLNLAESAQRY